MKIIKSFKNIKSLKGYFIGFLIGISFVSGVTYASTGTIGGLFTKIGSNWKLVGTNIQDGTVGSNQLGTNSVTTAKIANNTVTNAKLSDNSISTSKLQNSSVTDVKLANNAVTTAKIANNAVTNAKIIDNSISSTKIQMGAVTTAKIGDNAVTNTRLADNSVGTTKIQNSSVTEVKLANNAVTTAKIVNNAVTENKLAPELRNKLNSLGGNCPSASLSVKSTDTFHQSCSFNFPSGINMQIFTGRHFFASTTPSDIMVNHITGQCINGSWRAISFRCMHGGGK